MALKDITLGQYFPGNSLVHRLDPRTKLLAVVLYIVALFLADFFVSYAIMFALLALSIMAILLLGAAASAAGMIIAAMAAANTFIPVLGVDPDAAFRILLLSTTVLDSLPFAGAIVAMMSITGIKYKEGYPPIAMTTVLFTFVGNMIVAVLYSVFPMLP